MISLFENATICEVRPWEFILWLVATVICNVRSFVSYLLPRRRRKENIILTMKDDNCASEIAATRANCKPKVKKLIRDAEELVRNIKPFKYQDLDDEEKFHPNADTKGAAATTISTTDKSSSSTIEVDTPASSILSDHIDEVTKKSMKKRRRRKKNISNSTNEILDAEKTMDSTDPNFEENTKRLFDFLDGANKFHKTRLSLQRDTHEIENTMSEHKSELAGNTKLLVNANKLLNQTRMSCKNATRRERECLDKASELADKMLPSSILKSSNVEKAQLDGLRLFASVELKTERLLDADCPCYKRLKLIIQQGIGETKKLREKVAVAQPYFELKFNDPLTRVYMPQIMITSELALFMEFYSDLPSSLSDIRGWKIAEMTSWGRKANEDPFSESFAETFSTVPSSSIKKTLFSQTLNQMAGNMFKKLSSCQVGAEKFIILDTISLSSTSYLWTMFLFLQFSNYEKKSVSDKSKSHLDTLPSIITKSQLKPDVKPDENKSNIVMDSSKSSSEEPCSKPRLYPALTSACAYHPLVADKRYTSRRWEFITAYVIRLMKRRVHCIARITDQHSMGPCNVCRQPLNKTDTSTAVYCIVCHVKIHLNCYGHLFDLCAPAPHQHPSKKELKRDYFTLDDFINTEFKPQIPALIVHIVFLVTFGEYKEKGLYRNPDTDVKYETFKKLIQKGWSPNLLILEPLLLGEVLKHFLCSLRPRLITQSLFKKMKALKGNLRGLTRTLTEDLALCRHTFAESSTPTRETLIFLFMHLQEVATMKEVAMSISELTRAFTPVLIDGFKREQSFNYYSVIECMLRIPRHLWLFLFSEFVEALNE